MERTCVLSIGCADFGIEDVNIEIYDSSMSKYRWDNLHNKWNLNVFFYSDNMFSTKDGYGKYARRTFKKHVDWIADQGSNASLIKDEAHVCMASCSEIYPDIIGASGEVEGNLHEAIEDSSSRGQP